MIVESVIRNQEKISPDPVLEDAIGLFILPPAGQNKTLGARYIGNSAAIVNIRNIFEGHQIGTVNVNSAASYFDSRRQVKRHKARQSGILNISEYARQRGVFNISGWSGKKGLFNFGEVHYGADWSLFFSKYSNASYSVSSSFIVHDDQMEGDNLRVGALTFRGSHFPDPFSPEKTSIDTRIGGVHFIDKGIGDKRNTQTKALGLLTLTSEDGKGYTSWDTYYTINPLAYISSGKGVKKSRLEKTLKILNEERVDKLIMKAYRWCKDFRNKQADNMNNTNLCYNV